MNEELLDVLDKISQTISTVSGNLLCPSYHGITKYNHVNNEIRKMKESIKILREKSKG